MEERYDKVATSKRLQAKRHCIIGDSWIFESIFFTINCMFDNCKKPDIKMKYSLIN